MFDFPASPTEGLVYSPAGGPDYIYRTASGAWEIQTSGTSSAFVAKAGDVMTGHLSLPTGPAAANAVRKDYVDALGTPPPATVTPLMSGTAAIGTTTKYAREDHRHPSDTSRAATTYVDTQDFLKVAKAGDTMTGNLYVPNIIFTSATGTLSFNSGSYLQSSGGYLFLNDGATAQVAIGNVAQGATTFYDNTIHTWRGRNGTPQMASLTASEFTTKTVRLDGDIGYMLALYRANTSIHGGIGNNVNGHFTVNATGQSLSLQTAGTNRLTCFANGAIQMAAPTGNISTLQVFGSATAGPYTIDSRAMQANTGAMIGFCVGASYYGAVGYHDGSYYSFFGNIGAYIGAGSWATSDGRLKSVTNDLDPAASLAAVNALPVKQFTPSTPAARAIFNSGDETNTEPLFGWVAQDVEQIIPVAVRDIKVPKTDAITRAAVKGDSFIPTPGSDEAVALGNEDLTVKAINDRYMLTTLWSAVQRLSVQNDELRAELEVLKGAAH